MAINQLGAFTARTFGAVAQKLTLNQTKPETVTQASSAPLESVTLSEAGPSKPSFNLGALGKWGIAAATLIGLSLTATPAMAGHPSHPSSPNVDVDTTAISGSNAEAGAVSISGLGAAQNTEVDQNQGRQPRPQRQRQADRQHKPGRGQGGQSSQRPSKPQQPRITSRNDNTNRNTNNNQSQATAHSDSDASANANVDTTAVGVGQGGDANATGGRSEATAVGTGGSATQGQSSTNTVTGGDQSVAGGDQSQTATTGNQSVGGSNQVVEGDNYDITTIVDPLPDAPVNIAPGPGQQSVTVTTSGFLSATCSDESYANSVTAGVYVGPAGGSITVGDAGTNPDNTNDTCEGIMETAGEIAENNSVIGSFQEAEGRVRAGGAVGTIRGEQYFGDQFTTLFNNYGGTPAAPEATAEAEVEASAEVDVNVQVEGGDKDQGSSSL